MEARGLVDITLGIAGACLRDGYPATVALQAYLRRSRTDLHALSGAGGRPRIVKGAYYGDTDDFSVIRTWFRDLVEDAFSSGKEFSVGTHDPSLIAWMTETHRDAKGLIELSFLRGLSDATKHNLARSGWRVSEYVPFGNHAAPYIARRERYLRDLARKGMAPAP
jgi:proline dehydrogenase